MERGRQSRPKFAKPRYIDPSMDFPRPRVAVSEQVQRTDTVLDKIESVLQRDVFIAPKRKEEVGSHAFRLEYGPETPRQAIYDDVFTYLGEYRLQAKETFYDLLFSREEDGLHIRDANRGIAMVDAAKKSIQRGDKLSRRIAEYRALEIEDTYLEKAEDGDLIIQASPPGNIAKEDGTYGFIFVGKVEKVGDEHKIIHKNAIRIDNATIDQYNQALSQVTGLDINHTTPEGLIGDPHFLGKTTSYQEIQLILNKVFNFAPSSWERRRNEWIIEQVRPFIDHLVEMCQSEDLAEEAFQFLEKIENKVLDLKQHYKRGATETTGRRQVTRQEIEEFERRYNYKPPAAGGSCGKTGSESSVQLSYGSAKSFTSSSSMRGSNEDQYGSLSFNCPHCGFLNVREKGKFIEICGENARPHGCGELVRC